MIEMAADLLETIRTLPRVELAAGDVLITESRQPEGLFFLESGSVEVLKGPTRIARSSVPGSVFGEVSLLLASCSTATVRATEPSSFHVARDGEAFLRENPAIAFSLARLLAHRLEAVTRYVADIKSQFKDSATHLDMVETVVDTLIAKHPREIDRKNRGH